ncbi:hypothetical protein SNEBB_003146 [Seison nebaliae]|nr:hypothetical protein SNEBB_003146 [Seison nebaliae]
MTDIITIRVVAQFEPPSIFYLVLPNINIKTLSLCQLSSLIYEQMPEDWPIPIRRKKYDTFQLYSLRQKTKTNNLIVDVTYPVHRIDNDGDNGDGNELRLEDIGIRHECELSFFNYQLYELYYRH